MVTNSYVQKQLMDINARFGRLVRNLGYANDKTTLRYKFETDFAYALNEIEKAPPYIPQKFVDRAGQIVDELVKAINVKSQDKPTR